MKVELIGGPLDGMECDVESHIHTIQRTHGFPRGAIAGLDHIPREMPTGMFTTTYLRGGDGVFRWSGESKEIVHRLDW